MNRLKAFGVNPHARKELREIGKRGVEALFVKAVQKAGGKAYKFVSEMNRGVSDRIVIFPGQAWFVEVKRSKGKMSKLQKVFQDKIIDFELLHFVVYGREGIKLFLEEVEWLKENGISKDK